MKYFKTRQLFSMEDKDLVYWQKRKLIPLGTLEHPYSYEKDKIPVSDIVTISYDEATKLGTERKSINTLILGGMGDGKSLIAKNIWYHLYKAGYYTGYVDSKSYDAGRAKFKWSEGGFRQAPYTSPEGIKLKHYLPYYVAKKTKDKSMLHNFSIYANNLKDINEKELWDGLRFRDIASSKIAMIIEKYGDDISRELLEKELKDMNRKEDTELATVSLNSALGRLVDIFESGLVSDSFKNIDLLDDWVNGYSVVISYSYQKPSDMQFDIGMRIRDSEIIQAVHRQRAVCWILDDAGLYLDKQDGVRFNYAVDKVIGTSTVGRSLGVDLVVLIQTLNLLDKTISEMFKNIIISPLFKNPDSLSNTNVPREVINRLKYHELFADNINNIYEWVLCFGKFFVTFYVFNPPVNHFKEVYFRKDEQQHSAVSVW